MVTFWTSDLAPFLQRFQENGVPHMTRKYRHKEDAKVRARRAARLSKRICDLCFASHRSCRVARRPLSSRPRLEQKNSLILSSADPRPSVRPLSPTRSAAPLSPAPPTTARGLLLRRRAATRTTHTHTRDIEAWIYSIFVNVPHSGHVIEVTSSTLGADRATRARFSELEPATCQVGREDARGA